MRHVQTCINAGHKRTHHTESPLTFYRPYAHDLTAVGGPSPWAHPLRCRYIALHSSKMASCKMASRWHQGIMDHKAQIILPANAKRVLNCANYPLWRQDLYRNRIRRKYEPGLRLPPWTVEKSHATKLIQILLYRPCLQKQ